MIHGAALDQVMHTLTQEAGASLSHTTSQADAVKHLEEAVRVHPLWRAFLRIGRQEGEIMIRRRDGSQIPGRYLAATNVIPGVHVSVLAKV